MKTISEASSLIRAGELSPVELTRSVLARIERFDGKLESYVDVYEEEALSQARAAEAAVTRGDRLGLLHGIPLALKDLYDVAGKPTLAGSAVREGHVAAEDSAVTTLLREAGAVLVGKTVTHEFAFGVVSAPTRNPWNLDTIPGGSSGGSAAAAAAGLCLGAMGTDTGGSIRIPAGLTGLVGLKPTFGRVSKRGVAPLSWSLDHAGPLTRTVTDAALIFQSITGFDPADPDSVDEPVTNVLAGLDSGIAGLRIGVPANYFFDDLAPGVAAAVQAALDVLADAGAELVEVTVPDVECSREVVTTIVGVEAALIHREELRTRPHDYTEDTRERLTAGAAIPGTAYVDAMHRRRLIVAGFRSALSEVDVVATPTLPVTAPPYGIAPPEAMAALTRLTSPLNAAGLPALAVPCGFADGLPVSLQLAGRPFDEATVLRAGAAYQQRTDWHTKHPPLTE
ncbi:amidase [Amycolatopsis alkalitolerans]|uniref:Amidase n=1 Tax=Amycolatopsis alkalitolerans TaxID=2547244 RepID=A0A5C4LXT6_9PSEU|nr:amidase [Amycolatopsis alkalitolerans]TNC24422.1 amidase [Amycolatopsis alkalitolerans]